VLAYGGNVAVWCPNPGRHRRNPRRSARAAGHRPMIQCQSRAGLRVVLICMPFPRFTICMPPSVIPANPPPEWRATLSGFRYASPTHAGSGPRYFDSGTPPCVLLLRVPPSPSFGPSPTPPPRSPRCSPILPRRPIVPHAPHTPPAVRAPLPESPPAVPDPPRPPPPAPPCQSQPCPPLGARPPSPPRPQAEHRYEPAVSAGGGCPTELRRACRAWHIQLASRQNVASALSRGTQVNDAAIGANVSPFDTAAAWPRGRRRCCRFDWLGTSTWHIPSSRKGPRGGESSRAKPGERLDQGAQ